MLKYNYHQIFLCDGNIIKIKYIYKLNPTNIMFNNYRHDDGAQNNFKRHH